MTNFPHLAQRLFNVPLALHPAKAEIVVAAIADRFGIAHLFRGNKPVAFDDFEMGEQAPDRAYEVVAGVALIPIIGTLVQQLGTLRPFSGMTGYDGIRLNLIGALADPAVEAIVLDINSPGGEVAGCFDLVDTIYRARGEKPIWAVLNEDAYSAAYAIASAADNITVPRTGGTGSVGVIAMHTDFSQALGKAGVTVTLITYGDHKADGNQNIPLSKDALARFQADVDAMGDLFIETVARNRGMSSAAVRNTQAATFLGANGVKVGFADAVMAPDEAFAALLKKLG